MKLFKIPINLQIGFCTFPLTYYVVLVVFWSIKGISLFHFHIWIANILYHSFL